MAVISLELDQNEEKMVDFLSEHYEQDRVSLIKRSLRELYENIIDMQVISDFEARKRRGEVEFVSADEVRSMLKNKTCDRAPAPSAP